MEIARSLEKDYPNWCTIKYRPIYKERVESFSLMKGEEIIGYAVVVFDYDYEINAEKEQEIKTFLGSFEVKYKNQGHGTFFLQYLTEHLGPMILHNINESGPFYYKNGAYLVDNSELFECGIMAIGLKKPLENMVEPYCRILCKECDLFHFIDYDECM